MDKLQINHCDLSLKCYTNERFPWINFNQSFVTKKHYEVNESSTLIDNKQQLSLSPEIVNSLVRLIRN